MSWHVMPGGWPVDLDAVVATHEVDRVVQHGQHAQAQQVELDQADRRAVVLVPLEHAAVLHAAPLDRADLDDGPVADDHAPRVDAQRGVFDLGRQRQHRLGDVVPAALGRGRHRAPHVHLLGPGVLLAGRVAQRLGHVADGRARPVADDVGHLGGVAAAVALVDVLDDGLAAVAALDVDVDVGRAVALGDRNRSNSRPRSTASTLVMPSA